MVSAKQIAEEVAQDVSVWATEMSKKYSGITLEKSPELNTAIVQLETLARVLRTRIRK